MKTFNDIHIIGQKEYLSQATEEDEDTMLAFLDAFDSGM